MSNASSAYEDAAAALQTAAIQVEEELIQAKEAHRKNQTPETAKAKAEAVQSLQQVRAMERGNRPTAVVGDAYPTPADELITDTGDNEEEGA